MCVEIKYNATCIPVGLWCDALLWQTSPRSCYEDLDRPSRYRITISYVNIVTALFGTVRTRFTDSPLYSPLQPSCRKISVTVLITPTRGCCGTSSPLRAPLTILLCVCSRVRTTSCGYVVTEATIFDAAEQPRNCRGVKSSDELRRAQDLSCSYRGNCTPTCRIPRRLGNRPRKNAGHPSVRYIVNAASSVCRYLFSSKGWVIKRVFITQRGFVQIVLVAPAAIADKIWRDQGCSRVKGWYPLA